MAYDQDVFSGNGSLKPDEDVFKDAKSPAAQPKAPAQPVTDFSGNLRFATPFGTVDSRIPMPEWLNKRMAQFGSGIADWGLGARQIVASDKPSGLGDLVTGNSDASRLKAEAADKRRVDKALNDDLLGKGLSFAGNVAPSLAIPTGYLGALGVAAPIVEGALAGGTAAALQPTVEGESRGVNTALGTVGGAAIPSVVAGVKTLAKPANPAAVALADKYQIPLGVADASENKFLKGARGVLNDTAIVGIGGRAQDAAKQGAFNKAVGETFGAAEEKLTPQVMDAAKGRIGAELDRLWNGNAVTVDPALLNKVHALRAEADKLPMGEAGRLHSWLDDVLSKVKTDPNGNAIIPGDVANRLQSKLGKDVNSAGGFLKENLGDLRREIISAFNRSVTGADADALALARSQYKNFKTVQPLLDKGVVGVAGREAGDVPAALLPEAVRKSFPNLSTQTTQPALAELAQVGSKYVADRSLQTGGAPRALIQNGLLGGALGAGALSNPVTAAWTVGVGMPTAATLNQALGSNALRKALTTQQVQRGLLAAPELGPASLELLKKGLLNSPALLAPTFIAMPAPSLE